MTRTTGTKMPATRSARRCTGARDPWACSTRRTIWASAVSEPTRVASTTRCPLVLTVAPTTASPGPTSTGHRFAGDHRAGRRPTGPTRRCRRWRCARRVGPRSGPRPAGPRRGSRSRRRGATVLAPSVGERPQRVTRPTGGPGLEPLAQQDQRDDDGGGLEVDVDRRRRCRPCRPCPPSDRRRCHRRPGTSSATVDQAHAASVPDRDEGVHGGGAVPGVDQRRSVEGVPADEHDRGGQDERQPRPARRTSTAAPSRSGPAGPSAPRRAGGAR